jgi:ABC-type tungstate transport system permease subunit
MNWLVSDAGQSAIAGFRIHGEQAFYPNARPSRGLKPE